MAFRSFAEQAAAYRLSLEGYRADPTKLSDLELEKAVKSVNTTKGSSVDTKRQVCLVTPGSLSERLNAECLIEVGVASEWEAMPIGKTIKTSTFPVLDLREKKVSIAEAAQGPVVRATRKIEKALSKGKSAAVAAVAYYAYTNDLSWLLEYPIKRIQMYVDILDAIGQPPVEEVKGTGGILVLVPGIQPILAAYLFHKYKVPVRCYMYDALREKGKRHFVACAVPNQIDGAQIYVGYTERGPLVAHVGAELLGGLSLVAGQERGTGIGKP